MKKLVICACRKYKKIPRDVLNEAVMTAMEAGISCEIVPDLCLDGASGRTFDANTLQLFAQVVDIAVRKG